MYSEQLKSLTLSLFPKGLAYKFVKGGFIDKLLNALVKSESRLLDDFIGTYDHAIADNPNFTEEDATLWEYRLGLINGSGVALEARKQAINLKLNYPITDAPRQYYLYIQEQLRAAGFDVYVYENKFSGQTLTPYQVLGPVNATMHKSSNQHGNIQHASFQPIGAFHNEDIQHGTGLQHGARFKNIIANSLEEESDAFWVVGNTYRYTFYIAGANFPEFAQIPSSRKRELRQLLLQLKPLHSVGFLFVNYV